MVYRGQVKNGVIVVEGNAHLAEGTVVNVETVEDEPLGKKLMKFAGTVKDLPEDMAENHDHYIHGTPKK